MIYDIKKHLLEEGIVDHVKNNFGKYGLAAAGLAAAGAGEFGDAAEGLTHSATNAVHSAGEGLANMGHRTMDHYAGAPETAHTGTETAHTGTETKDKTVVDTGPKDTTTHGMLTDTKTTHTPTYDPVTGEKSYESDDSTSLNLAGKILAGTGAIAGTAGLAGMSPAAKNYRNGRSGGAGSGYFHTAGKNSMTRNLNHRKMQVNNLRAESRANK